MITNVDTIVFRGRIARVDPQNIIVLGSNAFERFISSFVGLMGV